MSKVMTMPKIGVNMTEAQIVEWLVREGDPVKAGDVILTAETDKAVQEIACETDGVLEKILAEPGRTVKCQEPIAILAESGEKSEPYAGDAGRGKAGSGRAGAETGTAGTLPEPAGGAAVAPEPEPASDHEAEPRRTAAAAAVGPSSRARISPLAKKLARDRGLPLTDLRPGREGERIVKADVLRHGAGRAASPERAAAGQPAAAGTVIPVTGVRKVVAERLSLSARSAVRAVLFASVEAETLVESRERLKKNGVKVSYTDIIVHAAARLLRDFPIMNSRWTDKGIELAAERNIGIAADTEKGLVVPVIPKADEKSLEEIARESAEKIARAREGKLRAEDVSGGTFTITNLGMFDVETFIPVINPPECAILGVGSLRREPVVRGDPENLEIGWVLRLSLAFDHRIVDGAPAARFLQALKDKLKYIG